MDPTPSTQDQGPAADVEAGQALVSRGPGAGQAIPLRPGRNELCPPGSNEPELTLEVKLDDEGKRWRLILVQFEEGASWSLLNQTGHALREGLSLGEVVCESGDKRELWKSAARAVHLRMHWPAQPAPEGWLVVVGGEETGRRFPLRLGSVKVGPQEGCDLVLAGPAGGPSATLVIHRGYQATLTPATWGPRATWQPTGKAEPEPFGGSEVKLLGQAALQLHLTGLAGPPRAFLSALSGPSWGQAYPLGELDLALGQVLPWRAAQLSPAAAAAVQATRVRPNFELVLPEEGEGVQVSGAAGGTRLQEGSVLRFGALRLRFDLTSAGRGQAQTSWGPEGAPWPAEEQAPLPKGPPISEIDLDLKGWAGGFALSSEGVAVLVASSGVRCLGPTGVERWQREGDRAQEPWQPKPCDAAFSCGGDLVVLYEDGVLEFWDVWTGGLLRRLRWPDLDQRHTYQTLVTSPSADLAIMTGRERGSFEGRHSLHVVGLDLAAGEILWERGLSSGRQIPRPLLMQEGDVFYRHVDEVLSGGFTFLDSVVQRGEVRSGRVEEVPSPPAAPVSAIADLDPERLLVVAGGRLAFWARAGGTFEPFPRDLEAETRRGPLALSPDRRWAACVNGDSLELWNLEERKRYGKRSLLAADQRPLDLSLRDDGRAYVLIWPRRFRRISFEIEVVVGPSRAAATTPFDPSESAAQPPQLEGQGSPPAPEPEGFIDSVLDLFGLDDD